MSAGLATGVFWQQVEFGRGSITSRQPRGPPGSPTNAPPTSKHVDKAVGICGIEAEARLRHGRHLHPNVVPGQVQVGAVGGNLQGRAGQSGEAGGGVGGQGRGKLGGLAMLSLVSKMGQVQACKVTHT